MSAGARLSFLAERRGFEPPDRFYPINRLAGGCLQPLGHLSASLMAEGVGFEPTEPCGSAVFKTAALNHSAIPPNRYDSTSYVGSSNFLRFVLATVLATVFNPFSLRLHQIIPQLRISLSRDDARMTEDLLEGGQTTTPLQPQTRKSVAELVGVKLEPCL